MEQFSSTWIAIEVFELLITSITLYLLIVFCIMERRRALLRKKGNQKIKTLVKILVFLALFFTFSSSVSSQLGLWLPFGTAHSHACTAYAYLVTWSHALSVGCTFLALWVKLKLFYHHPILKSILSKHYTCFSNAVAVIIVVSSTFHGILFTATSNYFSTVYHGCTAAPKPGWDWEFLPLVEFIVIMVLAITCAVSLPALLAYPLVKTRDLANESTLEAKRQLIKRLLVSATVCVLSYLTATVILIVMASGVLVKSNLVFDVSLLISQIAILCTFTSWRHRLMPCFSGAPPDGDSAPSSRHNALANSKNTGNHYT